jgi:hypothetical protein
MMQIHRLRGVLPMLATASLVGGLTQSLETKADYSAAVQADGPVALLPAQ